MMPSHDSRRVGLSLPHHAAHSHHDSDRALYMRTVCPRLDLFNTSRNFTIAGIMLLLTTVVNIYIYYQESSRTVYMRRMQNETSGRLAGDFTASMDNSTTTTLYGYMADRVTHQPQTLTEPRGDGILYSQIEQTRAPFTDGQGKQLVILAYQRVGSSFLGQIFDQNPQVYYVYEPLDAAYTQMYGTVDGLNVPSDITFFRDGTVRPLPKEEKENAQRLLSNILNCHVERLPAEFFFHKFWSFLAQHFMPSWEVYTKCLDRQSVLKARQECVYRHLPYWCPKRFSLDGVHQLKCKEQLFTATINDPDEFGDYRRCMHHAMKRAKPCIQLFQEKCDHAKLRVTKIVRGTMDEMDALLKNNENLRILHLFRDPRPVVVSRRSDLSCRGIYTGDINEEEGGDMVKEAKIYCATLVQDLKHRYHLEKLYPGRIIQVIYEDFVQNPVKYTQAIYKYLDEDIPGDLMPWIQNNTMGPDIKSNAILRMNGWKKKLTYGEGDEILKQCKEFYNMINYKWPYESL